MSSRLVSRTRLSCSVHNTFKYVNICSPAGHWEQFDPPGTKAPTAARCFNTALCATAALQHPVQTLSLRCRRFDLTGEEPKESRGSLRPWAFEMMNPRHWGEPQLVVLMNHPLRLLFRQVPQNICLYFLGTKSDIWAHLTYRHAHSHNTTDAD